MAETDQALPPSDQLAAMNLTDTVEKHAFSDRVLIRSIVGRPDGGAGLAGQRVRAGGWVKTGREQGKGTFAFLELNDGSCPANLQVIVDAGLAVLSKLVATGTCVVVDGILKVPPEGTRQKIELRVEKVVSVGEVDPAKYPIPKTKLTLEFLRDHLHLRARTNTIAAIARIRNALAFATHSFFQEHNFLYVHTPILTTSDCEGAGEMFQVTTLISESEKLEKELIKNPPPSEVDIEAARQVVSERGEAVKQLKAAKAKAVELLEEAVKGGKKFENEVKWGIDLASEHERYLTEVKFQKPVIVYNYPKGIKAFYMRLNDDLKTVAAMDVLVPKVGELIGGSQREERYEVIRERILEVGLPLEPYEWYLDLRRYGTVKHCGFGLGFERMILFATGIENIRDVIPFPRYPGRADL
uniref:Aminoacyl-transfer RNA synthetases class-II family profile domain-containing protein n=1 Tax=Gossypium raimondii TaxID=29730 RepID=A0A0D2V783_GOSRA|nr:hypothetical protein B456_010G080400 [Gossypium raimondii]